MRLRTILTAAALAFAPACGSALAAAPPPNGGSVSIEPKTADGDYDPALQAFVAAAGEALATKGFVILDDPGHAAYVAELILSHADVGTSLAKVPTGQPAILPGASAGAGAGVAIPFSTGKSTLVPLQRTRLDLRLRKRGEAAIVWSGAAVTVRAAGTPKGADSVVAAALTTALLGSYPIEAGTVVGVP